MDQRIKESDIIISSDGTATFDFLHHGKVGGTYMGGFKFLCYLTPLQMIEADRDYRELLGPINASMAGTTQENLAFSLSQLRQRVITAPPFWNSGSFRFPGGHLKDLEVIELILEAAVTAELKYKKELEAKHEEAIARIQASIERKKKEQELKAENPDENEEFED